MYGIFKYKQRLLLRPRQEQTIVTNVSVCLSVCVRSHISETVHPYFVTFSAHIARSHGAVLSAALR